MDNETSGIVPALEEQVVFWSEWNLKARPIDRKLDDYNARQLQFARDCIQARQGINRILEIGCGTGWLSAALTDLAQVTGIDLSPQAIAEARRRNSSVTFLAGDFLVQGFAKKFDLIITADTMAHIPDQHAFIKKIRELLNPGGTLVLMTQNAYVWNRTSYLQPTASGQYRKWPRTHELKRLLKHEFDIEVITSIIPQGDRGLLRLASSRYCAGVLRKLLGVERQKRIFERLLLGKELIFVARLKPLAGQFHPGRFEQTGDTPIIHSPATGRICVDAVGSERQPATANE